MEMSALTFLSWEVMSALGWLFLVVGGEALVVGSAVVGIGGWPNGGGAAGRLASVGTAGAGRLGLTTSAVGLYTLPDHVTSAHVSMA